MITIPKTIIDFSLEFNKDIKVKTEESEEYENFTWNLNDYEFKKIEVFMSRPRATL